MVATEPAHTNAPSTEEELYASIGSLAVDAGLTPSLVVKRLRADVRATPFFRRALTNFHRFLLTGFSSTWLRDFEDHNLLQRILLELFSQSQFLADILVRNPELFRWLTASDVLKVTKTGARYREEVEDATRLFARAEKKIDALKRFQRRELLRIGAREILKEADVATTSAELSALADSIIEAVLGLAYTHLAESTQIAAQGELAVIGLGKLGGGELNFSSDIDLMFVYEKDGPLKNSAGRIGTLHEYYVRVAEYVVRRLSEHTAEGHFYRVDLRLRPDGSSGPLAMSRSAYFSYYEARGEAWERQMLIKARVLAGNKEVGEKWLSDLEHFVFPKTLLVSPLDEISRIKAKIEARIGDKANIKLGSGGIRDIEFSVQALQLLNGGSNAGIRDRSTVAAIRSLVASNHLKEREGKNLESAYHFLRTVEDRLQLLHGLQQHSLPESTMERTILARQLGYKSASAFSQALKKHQTKIKATFRSVFGARQAGKKAGSLSSNEFLHDTRKLRAFGFLEVDVSGKRILEIVELLPDLRQFDQLRPLLESIRKNGASDWCVENLRFVAESVPIRRSLQQVLTNERARDLLILLCSRSAKFSGVLLREPLLFESMIGRPEDLLSRGSGWEFLKHSDPVRFRLYNEFKAVLRFIVGETGIREFTGELSSIAEEIIREAFDEAAGEIPNAREISLVLLALGKLGGGEISIGSDLDVVLLFKETTGVNSARTAIAVGRRLREKLEGVYEIDFRLRPEGKSSPLATEYDYYRDYLENRASLWERQSLIRAKVIAGDDSMADAVSRHLRSFVYETPLPKNWTKDILSMRQKMAREHTKREQSVDLKAGEGGLADIEFLVQSLQLRHGGEDLRLVQPNTFNAVAEIVKAGLIRKRDAIIIAKNLAAFRSLEAHTRMNSETKDFRLPPEGPRLRAIAAAMGPAPPSALLRSVNNMRRENHSLFTKILKTLIV